MLINDASITGSLIVNASASFQNISVGGNIIPDTTNIRNLGSTDKYFKEIYVSTGSINFVDGGSVVAVLSAGTITAIQSNTSSANSRLNSIESVSASLQSFTASISTTNTFTSSATARLNALETTSASIDTLNSTQNNRLGSLETISASNISRISALETTSASVDTLNTTQNSRLTSLEIKTGSLATTGSNTFIGTQTITGSLFISSDLIVQGSSSLQNITASAVSIGTNIINLNTANPAIRYAGLSIGDSGSVGGSGSFLYDSVQDEMIFIHRGANTTVTSSVVLMGPQTFDNIGSETYPTNNRIQKGTGNEHLVDSCISDTGTLVTISSVTSSFSGLVGIGMTAPESSLHIIKALGNDVIKIGESAANTRFAIGQEASYTGNYINSRNIDLKLQAYCAGGSGGNIHFQTGTDGTGCVTTKMFICSTGNIGIGYNSPLAKLTVVKSTRSSTLGASSVLQISDASATGQAVGDRAEINFYTNENSLPGNLTHASIGIIKTSTTGNETADLYFAASTIGGSPVERMRITSGGNIGIGTCSPSQKLEVVGGEIKAGRVDSSNEGGQLSFGRALDNNTSWYIDTYGSAASPQLRFVNVDNSVVAMTISGSNVGIGTTNPTTTISGNETTLQITNANVASVNLQSTGGRRYSLASLGSGGQFGIFDVTAGSYRVLIACTGALSVIAPNHMQFLIKSSTSGDASFQFGAEDNVIIGMSMYTAANDISWFIGRHRPGVAGITDEMNLYRGQTNLHRVQNNGNYSFAGSNVSDIRLKENIKTIDYNATEKLLQLVPKSYNMIEHPTISKSGFIAQEVKEVLPNFVTGNESENEYLGLDYNGILALTVKAMQEQQCTINTLKSCLGIS